MNTNPLDKSLAQILNLKYLPWIGDNFSDTGLLIVGDSHYDDGDGWLEGNKLATRQMILNNGVHDRFPARFLNAIELLFCNRTLEQNDRAKFWQKLGYMNLVQRLMASSAERPSDKDFDQGWEVCLDIINIIRPKYCVKLGIDGIGRLGTTMKEKGWTGIAEEFRIRPSKGDPYRITISRGDYTTTMLFVHHPTGTRGFDQPYWTSIIDPPPDM
ncbi:MAG TPA: hypothetical protein VL093_04940 [Flavipsychrobacter sp.]|nr:hypothetical protein [Flavipsychrobacter sp.]